MILNAVCILSKASFTTWVSQTGVVHFSSRFLVHYCLPASKPLEKGHTEGTSSEIKFIGENAEISTIGPYGDRLRLKSVRD